MHVKVRDYLAVGPEKLLGRMFNKCLGEKYGYLPGELKYLGKFSIKVFQATLRRQRQRQKGE